MLAAVDSYTLIKFFHVFLAIVWIGGGVMLTVLAELTRRSDEPGAMARLARQIDWLSTRVFVPSALIVFGLGFWLVHKGFWGYDHFWIIYSIVAFAVSFLVGALFLGPQSGQVGKLIQAEGPDSPRVLRKIDLLVNVARLDLLLLASIVFMMVTKVGE
jgi:uncharacterized membrane protein